MKDREQDAARREFLKSLIRWTVAGAVVGTIARVSTKSSEICINKGICRGCGAFDGCGLPQALSAKATMRGDNG